MAAVTNNNKLGSLKVSVIALEAGSLKLRCWQGWLLLEALRENLACSSCCSLVYRCSTPISASVFTWSFSYKDNVIG